MNIIIVNNDKSIILDSIRKVRIVIKGMKQFKLYNNHINEYYRLTNLENKLKLN